MALQNSTVGKFEVLSSFFELSHWLTLASEASQWTIIVTTIVCFVHLTFTATHPTSDLPKLYYKASALSNHLLSALPILTQPYKGPVWPCGGHVHTILSLLLPHPKAHTRLFREYLQVSHDAMVALDWGLLVSPTSTEERPENLTAVEKNSLTIIFIPGMTGSMNLVLHACEMALLRGFRPVIVHSRGAAGAPLISPKIPSCGDPSDLREVVTYIYEKWPKGRIAIVGYGTGNVLLLSYLGEYGSSTHLCSAVAISPIWDIKQFHKSCPQPYHWLELIARKSQLLQHGPVLHKVIDMDSALDSKTLCELSERVYCPICECKSMEEFWDRNNPLRDVDDISIPLLVVQSTNDPIVSNVTIPRDLFKVYPNFFLVTTSLGGHCAFLEADCAMSWAVRLSLDYFLAVHNFTENVLLE